MKFNKKLVVTSLSTVLGLGIVGSITGTFAWYQYSTRASATVIGTSAGSSGMLQIKTGASGSWKKDVYGDELLGTRADRKLYPVTFGGMLKTDALPGNAYKNPEAGDKKMNVARYLASKDKEYFQFTVSLRAVNAANEQVERDVYVSELTLEDTDTSTGNVTNALRMHIAVGTKYFLVAPGAARNMDCHGSLDLDGDGVADNENLGVPEWDLVDNPNDLDYGFYSGNPETVSENKQTTYTVGEVINARNADGTITANAGKKLGTTPTTGSLDVTVTIWLEGWEGIGSGTIKPMWDPETIGKTIHAGLTFDVGATAFDVQD